VNLKKARIVEKNLSMEDWEKDFLELLEGEEGIGEETGVKRRMERDQEEELGEEEIEIQLKKIKKKKATEVDGIVGEVWLYSNGWIKERIYSRGYGKRGFSGRKEERSDNTNTQKRRHKRCEKLQWNKTAMHGVEDLRNNLGGKVERRDRGEGKPT